MTIKFSDYVKLEHVKRMILAHLEKLGLKEQVRVMNPGDLDKIIFMMAGISQTLSEKETDEDRVEMLVGYIVGLWVRLIVDYGADIDEL